ncbi:hypothetical protein PZ938_08660 [Luteipulveratus sp. YIM 133132]|uniref:hypothetical protein n=1 Tax=Luteipulveratus flavus TaxID=3031728 RepID=UPI0023B117F2|nr:hypothetical protein [Luteipulveratus sp. YIM 133132]MDE9365673.1 hypothetical protein [Luteipulveratus sp. YIM 133132]
MTTPAVLPSSTEASAPTRTPWWKDGRRLSGLLLLGLAGAYLALASWTGPRPASYDPTPFLDGQHATVTDVEPRTAHEVAWWQDDFATQLTALPGHVMTDEGKGEGSVPRYVVWEDVNRQLVWTTMRSDDPRLEQVERHVRADGSRRLEEIARWVTRLGRALAAVALLVVVSGHRPRSGNRWYWFWLLWTPLCIGVIWFAITEKMRDPQERRPRRKTGLDGIGALVGIYITVQLAFGVLNGL